MSKKVKEMCKSESDVIEAFLVGKEARLLLLSTKNFELEHEVYRIAIWDGKTMLIAGYGNHLAHTLINLCKERKYDYEVLLGEWHLEVDGE